MRGTSASHAAFLSYIGSPSCFLSLYRGQHNVLIGPCTCQRDLVRVATATWTWLTIAAFIVINLSAQKIELSPRDKSVHLWLNALRQASCSLRNKDHCSI